MFIAYAGDLPDGFFVGGSEGEQSWYEAKVALIMTVFVGYLLGIVTGRRIEPLRGWQFRV